MTRPTAPAPLLIIAMLCAAAVATGAALLSRSSNNESGTSTGAIYILGPARSLLSAGLYERADVYFHKGVPHHREEAFHGFFHKWKEAIVPAEHAHAEGREIEEIMPWLRLATRSDPHNIEVYLVASYWLNGECQRPDLAQQAILEAIEKNPSRYELQYEMGRLQLASNELELAKESLEKALSLIIRPNQQDPDQTAIDHPSILMTLSYLHEALGNQEGAVEATKQLLALRPTPHASERLQELESGTLDPTAAEARLEQLFHKTHECERDDHDHDHHEDHASDSH
ncbi:MAG: hypothetical protein ABFR33_04310 [Verrucomicrobiota bacterium]